MIDLTKLPAPTIVVTPDYETIYADLKARLLARLPDLVVTEATPEATILELAAYLVTTKCAEFNDRAKGALLAYATESDLDHLAALLGVERLLVTPADTSVYPPVAAVWESDDALRRRAQMAMEGITTAGSEGSYLFHALSASGLVADASVESPAPVEVVVNVLSLAGDGTATPDLLSVVAAALNVEKRRPLTDHVTVRSAEIVSCEIVATLEIDDGPDPEVVRAASETAVRALVEPARGKPVLGVGRPLSALYAALHQPGVKRVVLTRPAVDVSVTKAQAIHAARIAITIAGAAT